jgi:predicted RNA-binding protein YlqC (UPF0109 family)
MKELIEVMVKALVDAPEEVAVTETKGQHTSIFELRVARGDVGKVIGKEGRTAQSVNENNTCGSLHQAEEAVRS